MSKKVQSKLQDILPIFLEELEKVERQLNKLELSNSELKSRIQILLKHNPELNTATLDKLIEEHKSSLNNACNYLIRTHTIFTDKLNEEKSSLEKLFIQNQKKLIEINTGKKRKLSNFYLYTTIAFIVAIWCVAYAVYSHIKLDITTAEYNTEKKINIELFNFMKEKGLIDEYREWYEQMQEN